MPFEMKNLTPFPIERLCFDLKLEALELMEPRDVCELGKVNQGFQGMLVRDPSIVLGEHVYRIQFFDENIWIQKFSNSKKIRLNIDRLFVTIRLFVKKIRSCDRLSYQVNLIAVHQSFHQSAEKYTLLKNLKLVNELFLGWDAKENLERFFTNFHASVKKEAELAIDCGAFNDQVIKDWVENFMVGPQLKDCEKIEFGCRSENSVRFYYNALLNSEIKNVAIHTYSSRCMDALIIQQIVTNGIPSKNPEAAFFLASYEFMMDLSQYPGMRRIDRENRLRLLKQANDLARNFRYSGSRVFDYFTEEGSMFRQRFDSGRDCIFVYENLRDRENLLDDDKQNCFLAFYVPVG